jgi:hypothetical protein
MVRNPEAQCLSHESGYRNTDGTTFSRLAEALPGGDGGLLVAAIP